MLGIGVTTRNRSTLVAYGLALIQAHTPREHKLVVVDDASDTPTPGALYSPTRLGIAEAKTACLWNLQECDPIVLLDDDCWPTSSAWLNYLDAAYQLQIGHFIYVPADDNHRVMRPWDTHFQVRRRIPYDKVTLLELDNASGVMLYIDHSTLMKVGAFNLFRGPYGFEHAGYSDRCWRAGATGGFGPFLTISGMDKVMWSVDFQGRPDQYDGPLSSCMTQEDAARSVETNRERYLKALSGPIYLPLYNPISEEPPFT
jgi:glycosyltransferase involved in cell wall biosynthesis